MKLHYQYHAHEQSNHVPLVFIHGLFGSLSNLGMLARAFQDTHSIIQIDVRNHGESPHANQMNYAVMAQDVLDTLDMLGIHEFSLVGHSMGGKIAMAVSLQAPARVQRTVVLDIAPYAYQEGHHEAIFKALFAVQEANLSSRIDAGKLMRKYVAEEMVVQFLLKSFHQGQWRFNVQGLYDQYAEILNWDLYPASNQPLLVIRGGQSDYVETQAQQDALYVQFPQAQLCTVAQAGHWLHAEKTNEVVDHICHFLT